MKKGVRLVSTHELAKELGASRAAIQNASRSGLLPEPVDGPNHSRLYDLEACRAAWETTAPLREAQSRYLPGANQGGRPRADGTPAQGSRSAPPMEVEAGTDAQRLMKARADREEAEAAKAMLELLVLKGSLVRKADVEKAAADLGSLVIGQLRALGPRCSANLASIADPLEIDKALTDETNAIAAAVQKGIGGAG